MDGDPNERLPIRLGFIKKVYTLVGVRRRNRDIACSMTQNCHNVADLVSNQYVVGKDSYWY
ncbi:hypothetical protein KUL156_19940 [Alteromonas sp. KUL156]|nr:hypothetical protein KUL106_18060 [Alteromonas sp. KUL106]GFD77356.1 hypothetical protein KUL118_02180 [Tenacibaculum sp. KUL118]GFD96580.1 hypothetical protein KUL154_53130 [Alteromonas sp. KUL154]GFD99401.1 hypothetical protein KUL156_19940 [Alteromonas sp. KUL156]